MPQLLAGPGIHLNGIASRVREPGVLTFLDYVWNPEAYDAERSLRNAQILLWGKDAPVAAREAQQQTVALYDYLFHVHGRKRTGSKDEALVKLAAVKATVDRLAHLVGDPVLTEELKAQCLDKALVILNKVFPEKANATESSSVRQ